ncbi:RagB/SusD family nutrient uptake outer membrane protein [Spirosoma sp. BT702]|uniref:RagB/SusD family nutrient uptake outer membrane protein n=1 Tax=Spirosoma profusum TaxID=2771354 RepID=A0A926XU63_9BACT|nr:RagB/SusD family nutrient uptake outer membrane protein [Spirosoma profusum]MBD2700489.1 RagB/SusD family nutrient uptake outer membrane protein [Spirosoma profusum]
MKKILILILLTTFFTACSEAVLDVAPTDQLTEETTWASPQTAGLFLNDIYNSLNAGPWSAVYQNLPTELSVDPLDNFSDNATYGPLGGALSASLFDTGSYGPSNDIFKPNWAKMYANIRKCNLFISRITASTFDDATKKSLVAQARFLRAYFYKSLIDLYGGVPLITKVLDRNSGEDIQYPRNSYAECVAFIQKECTEATIDLPAKIADKKDLGRATKGAALALKGELELYAGKWADAVATHTEIMQSKQYDLFPDYAGLFYSQNENNQEVLFDIQFAPIVKQRNINQYWGVVEAASGAGWGAVDPTQNLIDDYEFADGKTSAEGSPLYDPQNPYKNRTKRFYASIIYDGSIWRGKPVYTRLGIANNANQINVVGKAGNTGRTGYFTKKLQDSTFQSTPTNLDGTNVIIFRYAEVLLNYAEAKNELSGPDQTVYDAINKVRNRAGLPNLPTGLTQEQMRQRIRRERRVELAFEGKRLFDLLRWRIAEQVFSQPIYGMKIEEKAGKLVYERVEVRKVKFVASKNYLMPIPQDVIAQNPKITQNPGY